MLSLLAIALSPAFAADPVGELDEPFLRAGLSFAMVPHSYRLTSDAADVPDDVAYSNDAFSGGLGFEAAGYLPSDPTWSAELWWKGFSDLVDVDGENYNRFATDVYLGARYRTDPRGGLRWYGSLGIHRYKTPFFRYASATDTSGAPRLLDLAVTGARLGVGGQYQKQRLLVDFGIGQTLAPQPVDLNLGATAEYLLGKTIAAWGALDVDSRSIAYELTGGDATVHDTELSILLGVSYWFADPP